MVLLWHKGSHDAPMSNVSTKHEEEITRMQQSSAELDYNSIFGKGDEVQKYCGRRSRREEGQRKAKRGRPVPLQELICSIVRQEKQIGLANLEQRLRLHGQCFGGGTTTTTTSCLRQYLVASCANDCYVCGAFVYSKDLKKCYF